MIKHWHANPEIFDSTDILFDGLTAAEIWGRDEKRLSNIKNLGYKVIILWEKTIKNLTKETLKEIIENELR
jgi:very-short-patch-repair endonuclease